MRTLISLVVFLAGVAASFRTHQIVGPWLVANSDKLLRDQFGWLISVDFLVLIWGTIWFCSSVVLYIVGLKVFDKINNNQRSMSNSV